MHQWVLSVVALSYLAAAVGWLRTARSAIERGRGLEHQGRPAEQWRTLAAKDAVGSLLFFGLAAVTGVEAAQGPMTAADVLLLIGAGPTTLSLFLGRRFERLSTQVEALEDLAYRRATHAAQRDVFADRFAERLSAAEASGVPGVMVRSLYEPVEGALGGDFLGVQAVGGRLDIVVGDVSRPRFRRRHRRHAAQGPAARGAEGLPEPGRALVVADAFLSSETVSESFATAFVAQYQSGVVVYANAGHPPTLIVGDEGERLLPPTGPLLGVTETPEFDQAEVFLAVGQRLVAFTDGLTEAYGPAGGLDVSDIASAVRNGGIESLHAAICTARHDPVRDDIPVVEVRRLPTPQPSGGAKANPSEDRTKD